MYEPNRTDGVAGTKLRAKKRRSWRRSRVTLWCRRTSTIPCRRWRRRRLTRTSAPGPAPACPTSPRPVRRITGGERTHEIARLDGDVRRRLFDDPIVRW